MDYKIVSDSSSNVFTVPGGNYTTVPMKIRAEREYTDRPELDVQAMVEDLKRYKGRSGSSCPNVQEWLDAFGDARTVFAVTISRNLSGSYNSAREAVRMYLEAHPDRQAWVFDSLSAGPEMAMLVMKLRELAEAGLDFEQIKEQALRYHAATHTLFCLESLTNLARNGRVSPTVAAVAGVLGIRVIGSAKKGQLANTHKSRGEKRSLHTLMELIRARGLADGGQMRIAHCRGLRQASALKAMVLAEFPNCRVTVEPTAALCSFYAEEGGLIIAFEGAFNAENNDLPA